MTGKELADRYQNAKEAFDAERERFCRFIRNHELNGNGVYIGGLLYQVQTEGVITATCPRGDVLIADEKEECGETDGAYRPVVG